MTHESLAQQEVLTYGGNRKTTDNKDKGWPPKSGQNASRGAFNKSVICKVHYLTRSIFYLKMRKFGSVNWGKNKDP